MFITKSAIGFTKKKKKRKEFLYAINNGDSTAYILYANVGAYQ